MKKHTLVKIGYIFLCTGTLSGCVGINKLDQPYLFSERTEFYESGSVSGKAEAFAHDLCVVTDDTTSQDNAITSEAAALFDVSDRTVLFGKNPFEKLYPASVTKVMTALLAIKYGDMSDEVSVTRESVVNESGATLCGIKPGDRLTMEQLLYGLMLPSGNDAGAAIAIHMDGSIEAFANRMNEEAKKLGATGTHFVNPHGLNDNDHYTTAYDLYLIFNEALKYPKFQEVIKAAAYEANYTDESGAPVSKTWKATNWYMTGEEKMPEGLTLLGGKTGTTQAAGYCLIIGSQDTAEKEYISVVLKAPSRPGLYDNMTNMLNKITD